MPSAQKWGEGGGGLYNCSLDFFYSLLQGLFAKVWECSNDLTLILLHKHRNTNGRRIVIQNWWCICYFLPRGGHIFAIEMGSVSRYFSKVSGSRVDLTLLFSESACSHVPRKWGDENLCNIFRLCLDKLHLSFSRRDYQAATYVAEHVPSAIPYERSRRYQDVDAHT